MIAVVYPAKNKAIGNARLKNDDRMAPIDIFVSSHVGKMTSSLKKGEEILRFDIKQREVLPLFPVSDPSDDNDIASWNKVKNALFMARRTQKS